MNASDMKRIMFNHGEAQKSFLQELRRLAQQLIGEEYESVYEFFREVLEDRARYKIINARRCQVLFELFCPIILLDGEVEVYGTFISSNALERYQEELRHKGEPVLIVDDVLIHGRGIRRLYELFDPDYSRDNIRVAVFCRSRNAAIDEKLENRILKGYLSAFDYEWREISCRFVELIEASAIPYESFAGGLLSFSCPALSQDDDRFTFIANSEKSLIFFEKHTPPPFLNEISYDICLRAYSNSQSKLFSFVPYVFLKNIKKTKCNDFFDSFVKQLKRDRCTHIIDELSIRSEDRAAYQMRLFSSLANRIYGLYLNHAYGIMEDFHPTRTNMELCFSHEVAKEITELNWQDISGLLDVTLPYEEGSLQEDASLSRLLLLPDEHGEDAMYRFLSMYYYSNGQLDEATIKENVSRRNGLTMQSFYKAVDSTFRHELTAAQIKCWDSGQASGVMRTCETADCIAMHSIAGEQNFRFILQENRDYFRKRSKKYALELSRLQNSDSVPLPTIPTVEKGSDARSLFAARNMDLLTQFIQDNEGSLEEWYIPQFIS